MTSKKIKGIKIGRKSQLGSTLAMIVAVVSLILIFLVFLLIVNIPGVSKHESVLVKDNVDDYLNKETITKNSFAINNSLVDINGEKTEVFQNEQINK